MSWVVTVVPTCEQAALEAPRLSASASSDISSEEIVAIAPLGSEPMPVPPASVPNTFLTKGSTGKLAAHEQRLADLLADRAHHGAGGELPDQRIAAE